MEIRIKAGLINSISDMDIFDVEVTQDNYIKVRKKLEMEREKAIQILRDLKAEGKIGSISLPRNEEMQKQIDNVVNFKEWLVRSIEKIMEMYYR